MVLNLGTSALQFLETIYSSSQTQGFESPNGQNIHVCNQYLKEPLCRWDQKIPCFFPTLSKRWVPKLFTECEKALPRTQVNCWMPFGTTLIPSQPYPTLLFLHECSLSCSDSTWFPLLSSFAKLLQSKSIINTPLLRRQSTLKRLYWHMLIHKFRLRRKISSFPSKR